MGLPHLGGDSRNTNQLSERGPTSSTAGIFSPNFNNISNSVNLDKHNGSYSSRNAGVAKHNIGINLTPTVLSL